MAIKKKVPAKKAVAKAAENTVVELTPPAQFKLDLGCGKRKQDGFFGLDNITFDTVDAKVDLGRQPWAFERVYRADKMPVKLVSQVKVYGVNQKVSGLGALPDDCVDEAFCSHFMEHLTWPERVSFINELYRVLKPEAKCTLILPHWASARYYGDPTHKSPMSEWAFFYWDEAWRREQAPGCFDKEVPEYDCNFFVTYGYNLHPEIANKNQELQLFAMKFYKDAAQDVIATLVKKPHLVT